MYFLQVSMSPQFIHIDEQYWKCDKINAKNEVSLHSKCVDNLSITLIFCPAFLLSSVIWQLKLRAQASLQFDTTEPILFTKIYNNDGFCEQIQTTKMSKNQYKTSNWIVLFH